MGIIIVSALLSTAISYAIAVIEKKQTMKFVEEMNKVNNESMEAVKKASLEAIENAIKRLNQSMQV